MNPAGQVPLQQIFTSISNMLQRLRNNLSPLPPVEAIVEVLLTKTEAHDEIADTPLILISDVAHYFSDGTISYIEFSQGMIRNKTLLVDIYEPIFNKKVFQMQDRLKEIAAE